LHGLVARFIERSSTWGYLGQFFAISGWTSLPWLGSLRQPTLVLAGDDDPIVPLVNGRILARCIPNARLHVVRGGGHLFLLEQPARMAAMVADYLKGDVGDDFEARPPTELIEPGSTAAVLGHRPWCSRTTLSSPVGRWRSATPR
jgi:alpha/beta hydrolase fold